MIWSAAGKVGENGLLRKRLPFAPTPGPCEIGRRQHGQHHGGLLQHQQHVPQPGNPCLQAADQGPEKGGGVLSFFVADLVVEGGVFGQLGKRGWQRGRVFAPQQEPPAGIDAGKGVGIGKCQFRLADSSQPVDARNHARVLVGEAPAEFEQFIQPAGELFVVGGDFVFTLGGQLNVARSLVEITRQVPQHVGQVPCLQRGHAGLVERLHGIVDNSRDKLPAADLLDHAHDVGCEWFARFAVAKLRDVPGDLEFREHRFGVQAGDFDKVDRRGTLAKDVQMDLAIDPGTPLAAADIAGKIGRRQERQEEPRLDQVLLEDLRFPGGKIGDPLGIKKIAQLASATEPPMLVDDRLDEVLDETLLVVGPSVRHEEVIFRSHRRLASRDSHGLEWKD